MGSLVKSVRIDEEFLDLVNRYCDIYKKTFGHTVSVNEMLSGCAMRGMKEYMDTIKFLKHATNGETGEPIPVPDGLEQLLEDYEQFYIEKFVFAGGEGENE